MAGRVNVRFVVTLSMVLVILASGVMAAAYFVLKKSGSDWAALAVEAEAEGDLRRARGAWAKAVNKEPTNVEWLENWVTSIEVAVEDSQGLYNDRFIDRRNALRQIAQVKRTDVDSHIRYVDELYEFALSAGFGRVSADQIINATRDALGFFTSGGESGDERRLRRYRGMATQRLIAQSADVSEEEVRTAEADLLAALEADPDDELAAVSLASMKLSMAIEADAADRRIEAEQLAEEARAVIAPLAERQGLSGLAAAMELQLRLRARLSEVMQREADAAASDQIDAVFTASAEFEEELRATADTIRAAPAGPLVRDAIARFTQIEPTVLPENDLALSRGLLTEALDEAPDRVDLILQLASVDTAAGEYDAALAILASVGEMQPERVDLPGRLLFNQKLQAAVASAEIAFRMWESSDESARPEVRNRLAAFVERMQGEFPEGSDTLLRAEGQLAFADGDLAEAQNKLSEYLTQNPGDLQTRWLIAQVAESRGQLGAAKEQLEVLFAGNPSDLRTLMGLAAIEAALENPERAVELTRRALELDPENERAQALLVRFETAAGLRESDDPVTAVLYDAQRAERGTEDSLGSTEEAIQVIQAGLSEHGNDPRLIAPLVQLHMQRGEIDQARSALAGGIESNPDDAFLQRLAMTVNADDRVEAAAQLVRESSASDLIKQLQLHAIYREAGRDEPADEALAAAQGLDSENAEVIETSFVIALGRGDRDGAARWADEGTRTNADRVGGLSYRARIALREGEQRAAIDQLEEATGIDPSSPQLWALLGEARAGIGRVQAAEDAFNRAIDIRPNDSSIIVRFVRSIAAAGDEDTALRVARDYSRFARGNPEFIDLWTALEASVGDRSFAIRRREATAASSPADRDNKLRLASLYIEEGRWADARGLLSELREEQDDIQVVALDARWEADQGNLLEARNRYSDFILMQDPETLTAEPFLSFGRFMISRGAFEAGMSALAQGREFQSEEMEADRALAGAYLQANRLSEAADAMVRVLDSGYADANNTTRKSLVEALVRLSRTEEAEQYFESFDRETIEGDLGLRLLESELARGRGDDSRAIELLDATCAAFPDSALAFYSRARVHATNEVRRADALADLDQAISLDPSNWRALSLRAAIFREDGRIDAAMDDLQQAAVRNPERDDLLGSLITELLDREQVDRAVAVAERVMEARPSDIAVATALADLFAGRDRFREAGRIYGDIWERTGATRVLPAYIYCLLEQNPPQTSAAQRVMKSIESQVATDPELLMTNADVFSARDNPQRAAEDAIAAFRLLDGDPNRIVAWYQFLNRVFETPTAMEDFLLGMEQQLNRPDWPAFFRARLIAAQEGQAERGIDLLGQVRERSSIPAVQSLAARQLGAALYGLDRYDEAIAAWRSGLEDFPGDWEMNNNLAFVLLKQKDDAETALPHAEAAVAANTNSGEAFDTLGLALLKLGRADEAERALLRGLQLVGPITDTSVILRIHLAEAKIALDQRDVAERLLIDAGRAMEEAPNAERYRTDLDRVREQLGSAG
ncbi:MAG: tetratricopeptide repeat protein [Planctomycetota bacterium]